MEGRMIEVGEYVRTKSGEIGIFKKYAEEGVQQWFTMLQNGTLYTTATRAIVNHSKNIIDLIEVGDIVFTEDFPGYDFIYIYDKEMLEALKQDVKDGVRIKSILTKEQYTKNCYTVERKEE